MYKQIYTYIPTVGGPAMNIMFKHMNIILRYIEIQIAYILYNIWYIYNI
jgi:hypothetical protein